MNYDWNSILGFLMFSSIDNNLNCSCHKTWFKLKLDLNFSSTLLTAVIGVLLLIAAGPLVVLLIRVAPLAIRVIITLLLLSVLKTLRRAVIPLLLTAIPLLLVLLLEIGIETAALAVIPLLLRLLLLLVPILAAARRGRRGWAWHLALLTNRRINPAQLLLSPCAHRGVTVSSRNA